MGVQNVGKHVSAIQRSQRRKEKFPLSKKQQNHVPSLRSSPFLKSLNQQNHVPMHLFLPVWQTSVPLFQNNIRDVWWLPRQHPSLRSSPFLKSLNISTRN